MGGNAAAAFAGCGAAAAAMGGRWVIYDRP
jgi:hypothetical protein